MPSTSGNLFPSGIFTSSPVNPYQDAKAHTSAPFSAQSAPQVLCGAYTAHWQQITQHLDVEGNRAHTFSDDYYNRIHITIEKLALGNIVSTVSTVIGIWNSWLSTPQTLDTLLGTNDDGITYDAPGVPPLVFPPGAQYNWTFDVGVLGPPTVDAFFVWTFADGEAVTLEIIGSRITAWAMRPDWSNGVREKLSHLSDVQTAETGTEVRRKLRSTPRRSLEFDVMANERERRYVEASLYAWTAMVWALPIWPDGARLTANSALAPGAMEILVDTTYRDYQEAGLAILILNAYTYEVVQITAFTDSSISLAHPVNGTWPAGSRIFPARTARLDKAPQLTRAGAGWQNATLSFTMAEPCTWSSVTGLPQYRGIDVLEIFPDDDNVVDSYDREYQTIDNDTGQVDTDDTAGMGFAITGFNFWVRGAKARDQMRRVLYSLAGKVGEIWVPSMKTDVLMIATANAAANSIDVEGLGYTLFLKAQQGRRDIRIELFSGQIIYRRILDSQVLTTDTERLSLDQPFTTQITPAQVRRISWMTLSRQINDDATITHTNAVDGIATSPTSFRGTNHDV